MAFRLLEATATHWRKVNALQLARVRAGVRLKPLAAVLMRAPVASQPFCSGKHEHLVTDAFCHFCVCARHLYGENRLRPTIDGAATAEGALPLELFPDAQRLSPTGHMAEWLSQSIGVYAVEPSKGLRDLPPQVRFRTQRDRLAAKDIRA